MCGCGSCGSCGDSKPRMNGKEITILSGYRSNESGEGSTEATRSGNEPSNVGKFTVIGSAIVLAIIAGFASKK